ncbi:MAG: radical SAM protein [Elusimicrobia bacterium]|nr:radical SAM protein [Elusimicrobiota bacterium]
MKIDFLAAPAMITWQLTRDCDLACLHCCTDSAPGKALAGELTRVEALALADQIVAAQIPYVMVVGGEPTIAPHFFELAQRLADGGVLLKIETNGNRFSEAQAARLPKAAIRSVQVSIDGATQAVYARQRPGGDLGRVKKAARAVVKAGLPLEITFAPSKINIHEAEAVIDLALELGAFRFNTGRLMRLGTAAKLWDRLCPDGKEYEKFYNLLVRKENELAGRMELCFRPFSLKEELEARTTEPSGTLLVLPDGKVKVSAPLPYLCADLKTQSLRDAWAAYREAWSHPKVVAGLAAAAASEERLAEANRWVMLENDLPVVV